MEIPWRDGVRRGILVEQVAPRGQKEREKLFERIQQQPFLRRDTGVHQWGVIIGAKLPFSHLFFLAPSASLKDEGGRRGGRENGLL